MFGRAAITLGIGPHSSYVYFILIFRITALAYTIFDGLLAVFLYNISYIVKA